MLLLASKLLFQNLLKKMVSRIIFYDFQFRQTEGSDFAEHCGETNRTRSIRNCQISGVEHNLQRDTVISRHYQRTRRYILAKELP